MASKRSVPAPPVEHSPAPSGCLSHERADWLLSLPDLPWLADLRERHAHLAHEWADAVEQIAEVRDRYADAERAHRKRVRDVLAVGEPAPDRAPELDGAIRDGEVQIAVEDAEAARDELNLCVLDVLTVLRSNRGDLKVAGMAPELVRALTVGGANRRAALVEQANRNLAHLQEPAIEVLDGDDGPTPDLDRQEAA
jgi:hypothetical protein